MDPLSAFDLTVLDDEPLGFLLSAYDDQLLLPASAGWSGHSGFGVENWLPFVAMDQLVAKGLPQFDALSSFTTEDPAALRNSEVSPAQILDFAGFNNAFTMGKSQVDSPEEKLKLVEEPELEISGSSESDLAQDLSWCFTDQALDSLATSLPKPSKTHRRRTSTASTGVEKERDARRDKPIPPRFQAFSPLSLSRSSVQCLNVVVDYHGVTGQIYRVMLNDSITNMAAAAHLFHEQSQAMISPLTEYYTLQPGEEYYGPAFGYDGCERRKISLVLGILQRKIHVRDISLFATSVSLMTYVESNRFHRNNPYESQYYRYELDLRGALINESKCGLCTFCPQVKFLPFKNSSYLSHLTLEHGVFASNYIVPEGLFYGEYAVTRMSNPLSTRVVKALQCPACFQVIEVACWKNKTNPLLSYFRHFKKHHLNLTKTFTQSVIDPVGQR